MAIIIEGDNNGIAAEGSVTIGNINFVWGKGIQHEPTADKPDKPGEGEYEMAEVMAEELTEDDSPAGDDFDSRFRKAMDMMWEEGVMQHKYDYAFIKMYMEWASREKKGKVDYPAFSRTGSYLKYLQDTGCRNVPGSSTFNQYYDTRLMKEGKIILREDINEEKRRNAILGRFAELME